jgi:acetyl esterase/lipase
VTVRGTDGAFIPPAFRDLHQSWAEKLETNLTMLGMAENHGLDAPQCCRGRVRFVMLTSDHLDLLGVPITERKQPDAYPLWGRFDGLPKTYIQICGVDILRDDAVCYARALQNAGIEVRLSMYEVCYWHLMLSSWRRGSNAQSRCRTFSGYMLPS